MGGGGSADGNIYSLGILSDQNVFLIDLNTIGDVNGLRLCINGDCIDAWADVNTYSGSFVDTNVWTENWLDDANALVDDLNLNNNDIVNIQRIAIGHDNPSANIHIYGGGLITWLKAEALAGAKTLISEIDATGFEWLYNEASATQVRTNVGGIPTIDYNPSGSQVNVHVFDELRWYDDEDRDGNYGGFKAYSDLNTSTMWTLPVQDGGTGQGICTNGSGQLYFCDVNTGGSGGIADGNLYSLGILSDANVFQIDLNTVGDINGFRLCINGDCINSWADVNVWFDTNIPDTNLYTANLMNSDNNSWLIDLVPNEDADYTTSPDTGYSLGLDTNRWLRVNAASWYVGLLDESDTETFMFEGTRRCWNCSFEPDAPDFNYTHLLMKSGFAPTITVPEWRQYIPIILSGGVNPMLLRQSTFLRSMDISLQNGQTMSNIDLTGHKWDEYTLTYTGQTSNTERSYIHSYGARMDNYNGNTLIALVVPPLGCDVITVQFDEPLPNIDYSVQLTSYDLRVEGGEPEPMPYILHIHSVIDVSTKTVNGFSGQVDYTLYDATNGRIAMNPITGQDAEWCNAVQMMTDIPFMAAPAELSVDWLVRLYS